MANLLTTLQDLIKDCLQTADDTRPLPTVLENALAQVQSLLGLNLEPSGQGLEQWLATFRQVTGDTVLRETLLIRVLQIKLPRAAEALALVGALTLTWDAAASKPRSFVINWPALTAFTKTPGPQALTTLLNRVAGIQDLKALQVLLLLLISGPDELVRQEYARRGFLALPAGAGVSLTELTDLVNSPVAAPLLTELGVAPATLTWLDSKRPVSPAAARIELNAPDALTPGAPLNGLSATLVADAAALRAANIALWGRGWQLTADAAASGTVTAGIRIAGSTIDAGAAARPAGRVRLLLGRTRAAGDDALLLGNRHGTFFAIRDVRVGLVLLPVEEKPAFGYTFHLDGVRFGVGTDILRKLSMGLPLPGSLTFDAPVAVSFLQGVPGLQGGTGEGGLTLGMEFPRHLGFVLGGAGAGLWVDDMLVRVEVALVPQQIGFRAIFRFDARAELGPLKATVSGAGVWVGRWMSGNAGVIEPTGIGLSLAAGPISGGGYLARLGPGEYGGALSLKILGIGAFAYGIYKELPGGDISFVAVIGLRLPPPGIQVGFGFAISGFGGLVGINRRADLDRLRERLVSGTAGDVLFTDDPTRNAPRLLGEMRQLFPDERGVHVFGPTFQMNWLYIISLDLGLFIELPGPRKIFVAGSGRLVIGSEDFALVYLRLDFVGGIDLTASLIFFDGALVNSHILGIMQITGGIALRLAYGANGYFLFSVGGFHPAFTPDGLAIPQIARAGASVDIGIVWFRQQMYFAVTSNTVQFGSRTEAGVRLGPIKVHGWFGFDALVQFKPFRFVATVDAGMAAEFEGIEFASIRVRGELSGPGPLTLRATASVKVLIRISKSVTVTIDDSPPESIPGIGNLAIHLRGEIAKPENLRGEGEDRDVVFRLAPGGERALIPVGAVVWEQKRVPLDRLLQKAEGTRLEPARSVAVAVTGAAVTAEDDLFSVGTYADLSDAEALSGPTFSTGRSGFRLELAQRIAAAPTVVPHTEEIDLIIVPRRRRHTLSVFAVFSTSLLESVAERAGGAPIKQQQPKVAVAVEKAKVPGGAAQHAADAFLAAREGGTVSMPVSTPAVSLVGVQ